MATGRRAFPHTGNPVALIAAIMGAAPAPLEGAAASMSAALEQTVQRCLEKDPARRYQTARELGLDLRPHVRTEMTASPGSVAVLPFDNLSGDQALDYLRFALPEIVASALSRVGSIAVRPLASTRRFSGHTDLQQIGAELRVRVLVSGAFASEPGALRVSVEAADAGSIRILWSDTLTMASDMIAAGTQELRSRIGRDCAPAIGVPSATAPEARDVPPRHREGHELYLRSIAFGMDNAPNSEATNLLERSVQLDPGFAPAWTQLGRRYYIGASYGREGPAAYQKSEDAFQRGLALDPDADDAADGLVSHFTEKGDLRAAYSVAARLRARQPNSKAGHRALG